MDDQRNTLPIANFHGSVERVVPSVGSAKPHKESNGAEWNQQRRGNNRRCFGVPVRGKLSRIPGVVFIGRKVRIRMRHWGFF